MAVVPSWSDAAAWPLEPLVLVGVAVAAVLHAVGGIGRPASRDPAGRWRTVAFGCALASALLALNSPLEYLARQLFWAHMVQHLLLITVTAPLLALANPWLRMWRAFPLAFRRPLARVVLTSRALTLPRRVIAGLARPVPAWLLATLVLWAWHWPPLYDLTLRSHAVHHLEHALFLGSGVLLWIQVVDQWPFRGRLSHLQRAAYLLLATVQSWVLAGVLAFAPGAYYAYAALALRPGGLTALGDQQVGAGMMWVPGAISYSIAIVVLLLLWLRDEERAFADPVPACSPS